MDARKSERTVGRARNRLRMRGLVRGATAGLHAALWLAVALVVVGRMAAAPGALIGAVVAVAVAGCFALVGFLGAMVPVPEDRGLALLVDRLAGTDELVLTALHVGTSEDPNRDAILDRLDQAAVPSMRALMPIRPPRHLRFAPVAVLAAVLAFWLVPSLNVPWRTAPSPAVEEGRRLEERLQELTSNPDPPPVLPLEHEVEKLARDLKGDELTPEEAREQMEDLQKKLADYDRTLEPSADLLKDLEDAAKQLDADPTRRLGDALKNGDFDQAADAAKDLSQSLSQAGPDERKRAAEALDHAGQELTKSGDPSLQQAGEGLKDAAQQIADGQAPSAGAQGGLSAQDAAELGKQLQQAKDLGQRLASDQAALQRSQELAGALEGSRQRLGGDPSVAQGQSSGQPQPGAGQDGAQAAGQSPGSSGEGSGDQTGTGASSAASNQAGSGVGTEGHTWEDQGGFQGGGQGLGHDDRFGNRQAGQQIDDFKKLYAAQRLAGAQSLLAGVDGKVDPNGKVDQLPVHLTSGDEHATTPAMNVPATYQEQAAEAIEAEHVPPAYQQAVKDYFDQLK